MRSEGIITVSDTGNPYKACVKAVYIEIIEK